jgi:hypothetical protein
VGTYVKMSTFVLACLALSFGAQASQLTQAQVEAVRAQYFKQYVIPSVNVHNVKTSFPDGTKGFTRYHIPEMGWGPIKPYATLSDLGLHGQYCASDAVVLATHLSSTSYLSQAKDLLMTASDFAVIDVIKRDSQGIARVGNTINVVRFGGEVTDQGEKLRVTVSERPDYAAGHEYLLFLKGRPSTSSMPFHGNEYATIEVLDHRIYPSEKHWGGLEPGDSYLDTVDRIDQLSATFKCPG